MAIEDLKWMLQRMFVSKHFILFLVVVMSSLRKFCLLYLLERISLQNYTERDKIGLLLFFFKDKACVCFDMHKRDCENQGSKLVRTWKSFKELFLQQFLPRKF